MNEFWTQLSALVRAGDGSSNARELAEQLWLSLVLREERTSVTLDAAGDGAAESEEESRTPRERECDPSGRDARASGQESSDEVEHDFPAESEDLTVSSAAVGVPTAGSLGGWSAKGLALAPLPRWQRKVTNQRGLNRLCLFRESQLRALDIDASIQASCRVGRVVPVTEATVAPSSSVVLVVDSSQTMWPWREQSVQLEASVRSLVGAAARSVVRGCLDSGSDDAERLRIEAVKVRLRPGADNVVLLWSDGLAPDFRAFAHDLARLPAKVRVIWVHPWPASHRRRTSLGKMAVRRGGAGSGGAFATFALPIRADRDGWADASAYVRGRRTRSREVVFTAVSRDHAVRRPDWPADYEGWRRFFGRVVPALSASARRLLGFIATLDARHFEFEALQALVGALEFGSDGGDDLDFLFAEVLSSGVVRLVPSAHPPMLQFRSESLRLLCSGVLDYEDLQRLDRLQRRVNAQANASTNEASFKVLSPELGGAVSAAETGVELSLLERNDAQQSHDDVGKSAADVNDGPAATTADGPGIEAGERLAHELFSVVWRSSDSVRGPLDATDMQELVLGLVFVVTANALADARAAIHGGGAGERINPEVRINEALVLPIEARWVVILDAASERGMGFALNNAFAALELSNRCLSGAVPLGYDAKAVPDEWLRQLVQSLRTFSNQLSEPTVAVDAFGAFFERLVAETPRSEFTTPPSVATLLAALLDPQAGTVFDPCCGYGSLLLSGWRHASARGMPGPTLDVFGQEANPRVWRWAKMRFALHGIEANLGGGAADSFHSDAHPDLRADYVVANPPFNTNGWAKGVHPEQVQLRFAGGTTRDAQRSAGGTKPERAPRSSDEEAAESSVLLEHRDESARGTDDVAEVGEEEGGTGEQWPYGLPPERNANFAWLQHVLHHLAPTGFAAVVLANGSMHVQGQEQAIRKAIVDADLVDCIVALPGQLFSATQIPACIWIFAREKNGFGKRDRRGQTLFIDGRALGRMKDRVTRELSEDDVLRVSRAYRAWKSDEVTARYEDVPGFCQSATTDEIREAGYVLTPGRFVRDAREVVRAPQDASPFAVRFPELQRRLAQHETEGQELNRRIMRLLKAINRES
jgi:type I restriction enzyme M protein